LAGNLADFVAATDLRVAQPQIYQQLFWSLEYLLLRSPFGNFDLFCMA
jgi:hypothetical protein